MKKQLLSSVALAALMVTPALAADLPRKAPAYVPPAPPPFSWTGFYVGASAGFISQNTDHTDLDGFYLLDVPGATYGVNGTGFIGGVNVGYNWQTAPNWVVGIEADISGSSLNDTANTISCGGSCRFAFKSKLSSLGTVRGRIGYAVDRTLIYATGGLAYGRVENSVTNDSGEPGQWFQSKEWKTGWTVGGGLEYAFTNNWTARVEGLYVDLGTKDASNNSGCRFSFKNRYGLGRVGLNYKF